LEIETDPIWEEMLKEMDKGILDDALYKVNKMIRDYKIPMPDRFMGDMEKTEYVNKYVMENLVIH
jgi:hypothetical protein